MYIVDKHKDYYDYVSHVYGVDKDTTFDRRGSCELSYSELIKKLIEVKSFGDYNDFILEAGYTQYLFHYSNIKRRLTGNSTSKNIWEKCESLSRRELKGSSSPEYIYDSDLTLKKIYNGSEHFGKKELSIFLNWKHSMLYYHNRLYWKHELNSLKNVVEIPDNLYDEYCIELPILKNLKIPAFINAEDIWKGLSSYISSKYNDKTIEIKLTDEEKAVNHGFDKRESFRPHIK